MASSAGKLDDDDRSGEEVHGSKRSQPARIANLKKRLQRINQTKDRLAKGIRVDPRQLDAIQYEAEILEELKNLEQFGIVKRGEDDQPEPRPVPPAAPAPSQGPASAAQGTGPPGRGLTAKFTSPSSALFGSQASNPFFARASAAPAPQMPAAAAASAPIRATQMPTKPLAYVGQYYLAYPRSHDAGEETKAKSEIPSKFPPPVLESELDMDEVEKLSEKTVGEPARILNLRKRLSKVLQTRKAGTPDQDDKALVPLIVWEIQIWENYGVLHPGQENQIAVPEEERSEIRRRKEPARITNLKRRLARIRVTKELMSTGVQPDQRQLAALQAEEEIVREIELWETQGVVTREKSDNASNSTKGKRQPPSLSQGSNCSNKEHDPPRDARDQVERWRVAVQEARAEERRRKQEMLKSATSTPLRVEALRRHSSNASGYPIFDYEQRCFDQERPRTESVESILSVLSVDPVPAPVPCTPLSQNPVLNASFSSAASAETVGLRSRSGSVVLERKYYVDDMDDRMQRRSKSAGQNVEVDKNFSIWLRDQSRQLRRANPLDDSSSLYTSSTARRPSTFFLENSWTVWFNETTRKGYSQAMPDSKQFEDSIVEIGTFNTIQGFWTLWNGLKIEYLKDNINVYIFMTGVKPLWEDERHKAGNIWVARNVDKTSRERLWRELAVCLVGELLEASGDETVTGVVFNSKDKGDTIQVWTDGGFLVRTQALPYDSEIRATKPPLGTVLKEVYRLHGGVVFNLKPKY